MDIKKDNMIKTTAKLCRSCKFCMPYNKNAKDATCMYLEKTGKGKEQGNE